MPVKSILVYSVVYIYSHYTWSSNSSAKFPKTRVYFGIESFIDNFIGREKAYKPGYYLFKQMGHGWRQNKNLPIQYILIIAMSINFETSVIINETTTIKLIELNKKNNDNVFATAIYRHSRILLRTDDHFPVMCLLNQF